jgi:hypothetical protein
MKALRHPLRARRPSSIALRALHGALWLCLLFASNRGFSAPLDEAAVLAEARAACEGGNPTRGIDLLKNLYRVTRHPSYLHNQARCHEENGHNHLAAARYRDFLAQARRLPRSERAALQLTSARIAAVKARIAELERAPVEAPGGSDSIAAPDDRANDSHGAGPVEPATNVMTQASPTEIPAAATVAAGTLSASTAPPASAGDRALRIAGLSLLAGGAASVVVGAVAGLAARRHEQAIQNASDGAPYDAGGYQEGKRDARIATAAFIATPVLLGVGAYLVWRGWARHPAPPSSAATWRIVPTATPTRKSVAEPSLAWGGVLEGQW